MTAEEIRSELEGVRVESASSICLHCGGRDAVLLKHHCKDELELYCDWCERWTGHRIRIDEAQAWVEMDKTSHPKSNDGFAQPGVFFSKVSDASPV
jgi:hypothetical protein